jgi:hypothetical protein
MRDRRVTVPIRSVLGQGPRRYIDHSGTTYPCTLLLLLTS